MTDKRRYFSGLRHLIFCLVITFGTTLLAQTDLFSIDLSEGNNAYTTTISSPAISSVSLSAGTAVTPQSTAGFGGRLGYGVETAEDAETNGHYIDLSITTAEGRTLNDLAMEYRIARSGTGPTNFLWKVRYDEGEWQEVETFTYTSEGRGFDLSLAELSDVRNITLRIVAWNASGTSGRMFLKESLFVTGTVVINDPTIGEIPDSAIYIGETLSIPVTIDGDKGTGVTTNVTTAAALTGAYALNDGIFTYTPTENDLTQSPVAFTITLTADGKSAERSFSVTLHESVLPIRTGKTIRENFDSLGTATAATLPFPWRVAETNKYNVFALAYADAHTMTTQRGGTDSKINTAGIYNVGAGEAETAEDRAIGFMSSSEKYRVCALIVPLKNEDTHTISSLRIEYNIEKYRRGNKKIIDLRYSTDGENWTAASDDFKLETATDTYTNEEGKTKVDTTWYTEPQPGNTQKGIVKTPIASGETIYLGWFYYSEKAGETSSSQVLAIDDIVIRPGWRTIYILQ